MDKIIENASLRPYNTFGIDVRARWLAEFATGEELGELMDWGRGRKGWVARLARSRRGEVEMLMRGSR